MDNVKRKIILDKCLEEPDTPQLTPILAEAFDAEITMGNLVNRYENANDKDAVIDTYFKYLSQTTPDRDALGERIFSIEIEPGNFSQIELKGKLVTKALDMGITTRPVYTDGRNIPSPLSHLPSEQLWAFRELLLHHSTNPASIGDFIERMSDLDLQHTKQEEEVLTKALDRGVNILNVVKRIEWIKAYFNLLHNHPTHPISATELVQKLMGVGDEQLDIASELFNALINGGHQIKFDSIEFNPWRNANFLLAHNEAFFKAENPMSANTFLSFVVSAEGNINVLTNLIHIAASKDADFNYVVESFDSVMDMAQLSNKELVPLLVHYGAGANCGVESDTVKAFYQNEGLEAYDWLYFNNLGRQLELNFQSPKAINNKIPHTLNHIWLTNPDSPHEISSVDLGIIDSNHRILSQSNSSWEHIVWTNVILKSTNYLKGTGVQVRSIYEAKDELKLFNFVEQFINKKLWGLASDVFRYALIQKFGGVYCDLNFALKRGIDEDTFKYDYFSQDTINYFFAAKPNHPILVEILNTVDRNLNNPPLYISTLENEGFSTKVSNNPVATKTIFITLLPFSIAFLKAANRDDNKDMMMVSITKNNHIVDDLDLMPKFNLVGCKYTNNIFKESVPNALISTPPEVMIGIDGGGHVEAHLTWLQD